MARIHGLQHVQCFAGTALAHDDAVRTHTQCVAHQIAHGDLALAFNIGRACFQGNNMILLQLQLG